MKKDIEIPKVEGVYVAVVQEYNPEFNFNDWNAYIINDKNIDLEMVLIVSEGYGNQKKTSKFRHAITKLPKKSYAKIELVQYLILLHTTDHSSISKYRSTCIMYSYLLVLLYLAKVEYLE